MTFEDYEPEDAWHPHDPRPALIKNLYRRIKLLDGLADYQVRTGDPLDELRGRLARWHADDVHRSGRDLERARQLLEDIEYTRGRDG